MSARIPLLLCLMMVALPTTPLGGQQTAEELLQSAQYKQQVEGDLQAVQGQQAAAAPAQDSQEVEVEGGDVERLVGDPVAVGDRARPFPVELAVQGGKRREGILAPELRQDCQPGQPRDSQERQDDPPEMLVAQRCESLPPRPGGGVGGRGGRRCAHVGILAGT